MTAPSTLLAAALALVPLLAAAEAAPEVANPRGHDWLASASANRTRFDSLGDRSDAVLGLRRYFRAGSLGLEALRSRYEGGREGDAAALDAYTSLWPAAYANLRWQEATDGTVFADHSGRLEIYQGLPGGWEPAVSWDRLTFGGSDTDLYGVALGRYAGNFYLRARAVQVSGADSDTYRATARWYYLGDGDTYLEGAVGSGRSAEDLSQGLPASDTRSAGASWVWYFRPRLGFKLNADWTRITGAGSGTEKGAGAALYARW